VRKRSFRGWEQVGGEGKKFWKKVLIQVLERTEFLSVLRELLFVWEIFPWGQKGEENDIQRVTGRIRYLNTAL
jgi:hypothetical protein